MSAPFLDAWIKGGCVVCGSPDRDPDTYYAHHSCTTDVKESRRRDWYDACDALRERYVRAAPELLEALKTARDVIHATECTTSACCAECVAASHAVNVGMGVSS